MFFVINCGILEQSWICLPVFFHFNPDYVDVNLTQAVLLKMYYTTLGMPVVRLGVGTAYRDPIVRNQFFVS